MAEPLSFVASVVAVTTLAETVVTKGYSYLKAVKHCSNEVRSLMAETNALCGILRRLKMLLGNDKSKSEETVKPEDRGGLGLNDKLDEDEIGSSEDEGVTGNIDGKSTVFGSVRDAFN